MASSTRKIAVSLVALCATLALFATLSAAAQGTGDGEAPIINPAIDEAACLGAVASLTDIPATANVLEGRGAPAR